MHELPRMPYPPKGQTKRYPLIESGYGTAEEWNTLAQRLNTKAFTSAHGRRPSGAQELNAWVQSLQTA